MIGKQTKVLIVDDSEVCREFLRHIIESDQELKVVGTSSNGSHALEWLKTNTCDVITMDVVMPEMNGYEVTKKIMESKPIPIVIITSTFKVKDSVHAFKAMEAGALAILEKPVALSDASYKQRAEEIIATIKTVRDVKLIKRTTGPKIVNASPIKKEIDFAIEPEAVAIGASLGGPAALMTILSHFKSSFPVPIFIVQHIIPGFTEGLMNWLQTSTSLKLALPKNGEIAKPGYCYIAPDKCHMIITKGNVISLDMKPEKGLQPSVSRLFESMAETYGKKCVGVILTGMGKDGAKELLLMKEKGAYTVAQDEKSSVMFGMPAEAIRLGAACKILPLDQIPALLKNLVKGDAIYDR